MRTCFAAFSIVRWLHKTNNMAVTPSVWHWQERFEPVAVEDACRQQILKIRRSKSYDQWLQEKARSSTHSIEQEANDDGNQHTQAEIDAAFRDFIRRKRKQTRNTNEQSIVAIPEKKNIQAKPWCKPPSLHVNPKIKMGFSRKEKCTTAGCALYLRREHSEAKRQEAYEAWLARVRLEDRVRRTQRSDELERLEQQQREKHKITWRKKLVVCAYSTLVVDS